MNSGCFYAGHSAPGILEDFKWVYSSDRKVGFLDNFCMGDELLFNYALISGDDRIAVDEKTTLNIPPFCREFPGYRDVISFHFLWHMKPWRVQVINGLANVTFLVKNGDSLFSEDQIKRVNNFNHVNYVYFALLWWITFHRVNDQLDHYWDTNANISVSQAEDLLAALKSILE